MGITIRAYAKSRNVSYEAVRRQIQRYEKELEGHTEKKKQAVYLDDEACNFLDMHRQKKSIVISDEGARDEIDILKKEIDRLNRELMKQKDRIIFLQDESMKLLEAKTRNETLYEVEHEKVEHVNQELEQVKQELGKYRPTIFGFYRKDA